MKKNIMSFNTKITIDNIIKYIIGLYIISLYVFNNIEGNTTNYISLFLIIFGIITSVIKCFKQKKIKIDRYFFLYGIFILLGFLSIIYAENKIFVLNKTVQLIINLGIIFILNNFINSNENIIFTLKCFAVSGVIVALLILFTTNYAEATRLNRPGTQIGNVNSLAIQMCMSLSAILILKSNNKNKKYLLIIELLLISAILLTGSRKGTIILLAIYALSYLLKDCNNKKIMARNVTIVTIIMVTLITIIYTVPYFHELVWVRFENMFQFINGSDTNEFSIKARNNMIEVGWNWFKENPIFGYGLDNYRYMYNNYYGYNYYAHNNYIELLVDLGIIGTLGFYMSILYPLIKLIKMKIYKNYKTCVFFSMIIIFLVMDYAWVSYGDRVWLIYVAIIYAYIRLKEKESEDENKVSVIMSTYNTDESFLRKSIESILNQTHKNFEFIIINDGSNKDLNIIKQYNDKRIIVVDNMENKGLPYSLNKALEISTGKYIARMDSDDIAILNRLEKQVMYMEKHKDIGICGMFAKQIGDKNGFSLTPLYKDNDVKVQLLFKCALTHPTVMIRKEMLNNNKIQYNEQFKYAQDYELWSKCNMKRIKISIIPKIGLYLRIHKKQISDSKREEQNKYYIKTLKKNMEILKLDGKMLHTMLILNGRIKLKSNEIEQFCDSLEEMENKIEYRNAKKVINNNICNLFIKKELFECNDDYKKVRKHNKKLYKRIYNFRNMSLIIKRIWLIIKCNISMIKVIEYL